MSFNILQGGAPANEVGSTSPLYRKARHDDIAGVILQANPDIVAVQEDCRGTEVLSRLQANDPSWNRYGSIYAKFPVEPISRASQDKSVGRIRVSDQQSVVLHNAHWWPSRGYGPRVAQERLLKTGNVTEAFVLENSGGNNSRGRNPKHSLESVRNYLKTNEPIFIVGDFNEPSHRDWTRRYAEEGGPDRMTSNPTKTPLNLRIEWQGSKRLADAGFKDAYRTVYPNEIAKPGITWSPPFANGTPGRRNYDNDTKVGGTVLTRIDRIEYQGEGVKPIAAAVVGENPDAAEHGRKSRATPELVYRGPWPSDHRAVIATFEIPASGS